MNTKYKKLLLALGKFFTKVLESVKHPPDKGGIFETMFF